MAVLLVKSGKHFGKVISLSTAPLRIGRDQAAEIRIPSTEVSRLHCELFLQETKLLVRDLGSKNGTLINGSPVFTEVLLDEGDYIQVGPMTFEFLLKKPKKSVGKEAEKESVIANWLNQPEADELLSDTTIISRSTEVNTQPPAPIAPKKTSHEVPKVNQPNQKTPLPNNKTEAKNTIEAPQVSHEDKQLLERHITEAAEIIVNYWKNIDNVD